MESRPSELIAESWALPMQVNRAFTEAEQETVMHFKNSILGHLNSNFKSS